MLFSNKSSRQSADRTKKDYMYVPLFCRLQTRWDGLAFTQLLISYRITFD